MRTLSALLFLLLLCSLQPTSSVPNALNQPTCCIGTSKYRLPIARIMSYNLTSSSCLVSAVVFKMVSGKNICMDPALSWVKDYMKKVDQRNNLLQKDFPNTEVGTGHPTTSKH